MKTVTLIVLLIVVLTTAATFAASAEDCCPSSQKAVASGQVCEMKPNMVAQTRGLKPAGGGACAAEGQTACDEKSAVCAGKQCGPEECPLLTSDLGLNVQQMNRAKAICAGHQKTMASLKASLAEERKKLASILDAPKPDKAAALAQAKKVSGIEAKLQQSAVETFLAVKSLLTPAQAAKLSASDAMKTWSARQADCSMNDGSGCCAKDKAGTPQKAEAPACH